MEYYVVLGLLIAVSLTLAYRFEVLDYFVYVVGLVSLLMAVLFVVFFQAYTAVLVMLGVALVCGLVFVFFRYVKHY